MHWCYLHRSPVFFTLVLSVHASALNATARHPHSVTSSSRLFLGVKDKELRNSNENLERFQLVQEPGVVRTGEHTFWPPDEGNGLAAWLFAALFVIMIGIVPCVLHVASEGWKCPSCSAITQGLVLLVWLLVGLFCFTHVFYFSSPHFDGTQRTLTLVEAVYLFAQIITTVGYGDIIPAFIGGQLFVGLFVFCAILLIAEMVSDIFTLILSRAEQRVAAAAEAASKKLREHDLTGTRIGKKGPSLKPLLVSFTLFVACVLAGACFYSLYPGEGKTFLQGLYMAIVTLTTVGFGAFTAETEAGKVFGAFWMLIGVAALGAVVASFTELMVALKESEKPSEKEKDADEILHEELKDHNGRVDKLHYLEYALLKYNIASRKQVEAILKQYDALDEDNEGSVSVEKVQLIGASRGSPSNHESIHVHRRGVQIPSPSISTRS